MAYVRLVAFLVIGAGLASVMPAIQSSRVGAAGAEIVHLADGSTIALTTPPFIVRGKRYAFTWPGAGPAQTFTVKDIRKDGWVLVEVAEENVDPAYVPIGSIPTRWLNAALATSIQEMRPLIHQ
jgi:hypothetical protein